MAKRKPKVFFLHNIIAPYRLPVFEAVNREFELDVYFCKAKTADRKWSTSLKGYRFTRHVLPSFQIGLFIFNPTIIWQLLTKRYDVYLVGDFPETAATVFATILIAKLRRRPVVMWSETLDHNVHVFQNLSRNPRLTSRMVHRLLTGSAACYRRLLLKLPQTFAALSAAARDFLISEGIPADKISSGIQVMPRELLPEATTKRPVKAQALRLVYLGYLNALKGVDDLIAAVKMVPNQNLSLTIAGTGPEDARLKELAAGDNRITFLGYVHATKKANVITSADMLVLPTYVDCWALVVNEALHYGTPVMVTRVAGATQIIQEGQNGVIIEPRDPSGIARVLSELLNDPQRVTKLAKGAAATPADISDATVGAQPIIKAIQAALNCPLGDQS